MARHRCRDCGKILSPLNNYTIRCLSCWNKVIPRKEHLWCMHLRAHQQCRTCPYYDNNKCTFKTAKQIKEILKGDLFEK